MPKRYAISAEQVHEIEQTAKKNKDKNVDRRLRVLLLHAKGERRIDISTQTGYCKEQISKIVSKYCNHGLAAVAGNNYRGNNRNLSFAEEAQLLEPFIKAAEAGQIVEVREIKLAYEKAVGRSFEKSNSQIYCVLHRHNWRKIMPRSKHPNKASDEVIETSKKVTLASKN